MKTAAHFNVNTHEKILSWEQIYDEEGPDALYIDHRGKDLEWE